jgi:hypothetical protein
MTTSGQEIGINEKILQMLESNDGAAHAKTVMFCMKPVTLMRPTA